MIKFPKIKQLRQVVKDLKLRQQYKGKDESGKPIYDSSIELKPVEFIGYPKLHGTNASVRINLVTGEWSAYSKERKLSEEKDNYDFYKFVYNNLGSFFELASSQKEFDEIILFGEWCGEGIQNKVAICKLERMFVLFGAKGIYSEDTTDWIDITGFPEIEEVKIFNIKKCNPYIIKLDLKYPEEAINKMVKITEEVEKECPFAKRFGVIGTGEGVVYSLGGYDFHTSFKVKGDKHSKSKVKKLPTADVEKINSIREFIDRHVTEERLQQGWDYLCQDGEPEDMSKMGDFIRWMNNDIWTEEKDEAEENKIERKDFGKYLSHECVKWFKNKLYAI